MNFNPDTREKLRILRNNYRMFGLVPTLKSGLAYLLDEGRPDRFDRRYGVETALTVEPARADIADDRARAQAIRYVAVREEVIRHILTTLQRQLELPRFTFIDLGCGKGRALIAASWRPFAHIVGVELSPLLGEAARTNVERYLASPHASRRTRCRSIEIQCCDATAFKLPATDLVLYLYRPFREAAFRSVLDNACRAQDETQSRILLAYCCPMEEHVLERHDRFRKRAEYQVISEEYSWNLWECVPEKGT